MPTPEEVKAARARYMREWRLRDLDGQRRKGRARAARYRARKRAEDPTWRPTKSTKPRDPAAHRASEAVRRAVQSGRLVRPAACEQCGGGGLIEAAHFDYADRFRVRWLCRPCHRQWDYHDPKAGAIVPIVGSLKGEDHVNARLTENDVRMIRSSSLSHGVVAAQFDVHKSTIKDIRARRTWQHCA